MQQMTAAGRAAGCAALARPSFSDLLGVEALSAFVVAAQRVDAEITVLPASGTKPMRPARTIEHATVTGRAIAHGRTVADLPSFLSAFVLAQPSPRAVFGSGWGSGAQASGVSGRDPPLNRPLAGHVAQAMNCSASADINGDRPCVGRRIPSASPCQWVSRSLLADRSTSSFP